MNSLFKALADPTRREILELLKKGDLSAGEITASFPITSASISHHLSTLKQANLVLAVRSGQSIIYSLNTTVFQELIGWAYSLHTKEGEEKK